MTPAPTARRRPRPPRSRAFGGIIRAGARGLRALAGVTVVRVHVGEWGAVRGTLSSGHGGTKRLYESDTAALRLVA